MYFYNYYFQHISLLQYIFFFSFALVLCLYVLSFILFIHYRCLLYLYIVYSIFFNSLFTHTNNHSFIYYSVVLLADLTAADLYHHRIFRWVYVCILLWCVNLISCVVFMLIFSSMESSLKNLLQLFHIPSFAVLRFFISIALKLLYRNFTSVWCWAGIFY